MAVTAHRRSILAAKAAKTQKEWEEWIASGKSGITLKRGEMVVVSAAIIQTNLPAVSVDINRRWIDTGRTISKKLWGKILAASWKDKRRGLFQYFRECNNAKIPADELKAQTGNEFFGGGDADRLNAALLKYGIPVRIRREKQRVGNSSSWVFWLVTVKDAFTKTK